MAENNKTEKEVFRAEAKKARSLLGLNPQEHKSLHTHFFQNIEVNESTVIASYWPKERELDTQDLIDECLNRGARVALPVIQKGSRILKFVQYTNNTDLITGAFGVHHPPISEATQWLEPDIFMVPLLAFDRRGYRLGFGGGYYDATLAHYKNKKETTAIGLGYAQQACLFNLPVEDHDVKMDWIITQQNAQNYT